MTWWCALGTEISLSLANASGHGIISLAAVFSLFTQLSFVRDWEGECCLKEEGLGKGRNMFFPILPRVFHPSPPPHPPLSLSTWITSATQGGTPGKKLVGVFSLLPKTLSAGTVTLNIVYEGLLMASSITMKKPYPIYDQK